ncbi:MAG: organic solvent ABC transporter [Telmatospirillum sp.]|nr:organic solvent ABC transporter [Telmatospirillum sp.]
MARHLSAFLFSLFLALPFAAHAEGTPRETVQALCDGLLDVMKHSKELGFQGRADKLAKVVPVVYDMPAATRATLGVSFAKLSPDEARQLTDAFQRLSVASYAEQFDGFEGEHFEVGEPRPASTEGSQIVPSRIVTKAGQGTEIDYIVHQDGGRWKIVDVLLDGTISQTAVRRSEFVSIFRRDGFPGLMSVLDQKISAMGSK